VAVKPTASVHSISILEITMFVTLKTAARHAGTSLALLGLTSLAALPAMAETSSKATQAKPATKAKASTPANSVVVRDAETGQLRPATAEEAAALSRPASESGKARGGASAAIGGELQPKSHSSGAVGARLTDENATYAVATKRADGSIDVEHVDGRKAANAAVKKAKVLPVPAQLPTK
jgi:hypothetical protein